MNAINWIVLLVGVPVILGIVAGDIWGIIHLYQSYQSNETEFISWLLSEWKVLLAVAGITALLISPFLVMLPLIHGLMVAIAAALVMYFYNADSELISTYGAPTSEIFLYSAESSVDLSHWNTNQSFYRFVGYIDGGENATLKESDCVETTTTSYDFSGCPSGSYYSINSEEKQQNDQSEQLSSQSLNDLKTQAVKAQRAAVQLEEDITERLSALSKKIPLVQAAVEHYTYKFNYHRDAESRGRSSLRHCPDIWIGLPFGRGFHIPDISCHTQNSWHQTQISFHVLRKEHHLQQRDNKQNQLLALQRERTELQTGQQQLYVDRGELDSQIERLHKHQIASDLNSPDQGILSISTSQLGHGVHWVDKYNVTKTVLSSEEGEEGIETNNLITVDCPLNPEICRTMQLNTADYPLLFQQGINPVQILKVDFQYSDSPTPRWESQISTLNTSVSEEFALSLGMYYDTPEQAIGRGISAETSQIITRGSFKHFKHSGALKGRWHRGDIETDQWGIARWQRVEIPDQHGWYFYENPKLLFPENFDGIGYHNQSRPARLVDMLLVDLNEDGLDDVLSVYSDEHQTELRYRDLIDIANQSSSDETRISVPGVVNIDKVQLVSGTHHVHNRQNGVHYLLLQSKADQKLYLAALLQPMHADLTQPDSAFDALQIIVAEHPISNVLAVDALWHGDPKLGIQGDANQLILSWVNANTQQEQSVYVDPNQLLIQHQTYSLNASNSDNGAKSYQLQAISEKVAFRSEDIKPLENPECTQSSTYSYGGHLSLRLINPPDSVDDQLGAVISTTDRCELIRAMDPYHRGKSDRLLVRNHRDQRSTWRYSQASSTMSNQPFEFYMDFTSGNYQALKERSSLESAAYQYPLSNILQSQNLSFNNLDEKYLRQKMLGDYCLKQGIDSKDCLNNWLKNALQTDSNASQFSECDAHNALNNAMVNCVRSIVLTKLNQLAHGTSWESSTHKFVITNAQGNPILKRTDLSTETTDHIDINRLFDQLSHTLSLTQQSANNQFNSPSVGQSIWTDLVATTINTVVSPAHAGAEIAACLAFGPLAIECAALDLILSVAVVALAASKTCDWHMGGYVGDQLCSQNQSSSPTAEQKVAQHTPMPSEPEQLKSVFKQGIQNLIKDGTKGFAAELTAAEICSLLAEAALLDPEPGTKTALAIVDGACWLSLTVMTYLGDHYANYQLQQDSQMLIEQFGGSGNQARSQMLGLSEAIFLRVTNEGIASNTADFSSTNNSQIKPCEDNTDLCLDDTLRIRESDDGTVEVISLSTGMVSAWWHGQLGKNEVTGLPQLSLSNTIGNDENVLTYDVIKKDKQGNSILGLTALKRTNYEGTRHFHWTYNPLGQVISVVSGTENASGEIELVSSWALYHQPIEGAPQPLLDFIVRYDNQDFNGGIDMQVSEYYRFEYTQQEGHQHKLQEIEKLVNGEVTGYLKLGASASKAKPLAEMYKPCDSNNGRCYAIDQILSDPDISRTYAIPAMVYEPNMAMWLPVLGFTVYSDGIKLKTLSPTAASLCPTQYADISAPGNDLWHVTDFSHVQMPQPLQELLSGSLERAKTYYFKGTQIALSSMAKALLNQTTLREGMDKIVEEMQSQSIEIKNQDGQWTNVSTLFNTTAIESDAESETQNELSNQIDSFNQGIANFAELLGLQSPQINSPIGEIDDNTSVEQLADLLCPVSASPNDDGSPNNDYEEGECEFEEPESDKDQSETENLQANIPSLPLDVLMEYVERDPQGFHDEMQRVLEEFHQKLPELIKVNGTSLSVASQSDSPTVFNARRRLDANTSSTQDHYDKDLLGFNGELAIAVYFIIPQENDGQRTIQILYEDHGVRHHSLTRIKANDFFKALLVFRPIETSKFWYLTKTNEKLSTVFKDESMVFNLSLVFDQKVIYKKWWCKSVSQANEIELQELPQESERDDAPHPERIGHAIPYYPTYELRARNNWAINFGNLKNLMDEKGYLKAFKQSLVFDQKISGEITYGFFGKTRSNRDKANFFYELKGDVGITVKPIDWPERQEQKNIKVAELITSVFSAYAIGPRDVRFRNVRLRPNYDKGNQYIVAAMLFSLTTTIASLPYDSSLYFNGGLHLVIDPKLTETTRLELLRAGLAIKLNFGNLHPAITAWP